MFDCEKCGACCRYHKCNYLTKDNKCEIYDKRPDRCRVDKMYEKIGGGMTKIDYYAKVKFCCNLLRLVETFFDSRYEEERVKFGRKHD